MTKFLFCFGYCTPQHWRSNETHGWDDESSLAFFILADSSESALAWGSEVAEIFVDKLFKAAAWEGPIPSWRKAGFAHWIEDLPSKRFPSLEAARLPVVQIGEFPSLQDPN